MRSTGKQSGKRKKAIATGGLHKKETAQKDIGPMHGEVGHLLRRANQFAMSNARKVLGPYRVTPTQYAVLRGLNELGPSIQRRLALHVGLEPSNVHGMLKRMQTMKLVSISVDSESHRTDLVSLTKSGKNLVNELNPLFVQHDKDLIALLSGEERKYFMTALKKFAGIR